MKTSILDWYADGADYSEFEEKKYWFPLWILIVIIVLFIWRIL